MTYDTTPTGRCPNCSSLSTSELHNGQVINIDHPPENLIRVLNRAGYVLLQSGPNDHYRVVSPDESFWFGEAQRLHSCGDER